MKFAGTVRLLLNALMFLAIVAAHNDVIAQARAAQGARGNLPAPSAAKAKLTEAAAAAKKWKPDAILTQVQGRSVGADGLIPTWVYVYWSASARTCLGVRVYVSGPQTQESGGPICEEPELKGDFIDSPAALKAAKSSGITAPTVTMVVSSSPRARGAAPRAIWMVMDNLGVKTGDVMLDIDGVTGALLNKTVQR
jgi:hypothetical protein